MNLKKSTTAVGWIIGSTVYIFFLVLLFLYVYAHMDKKSDHSSVSFCEDRYRVYVPRCGNFFAVSFYPLYSLEGSALLFNYKDRYFIYANTSLKYSAFNCGWKVKSDVALSSFFVNNSFLGFDISNLILFYNSSPLFRMKFEDSSSFNAIFRTAGIAEIKNNNNILLIPPFSPQLIIFSNFTIINFTQFFDTIYTPSSNISLVSQSADTFSVTVKHICFSTTPLICLYSSSYMKIDVLNVSSYLIAEILPYEKFFSIIIGNDYIKCVDGHYFDVEGFYKIKCEGGDKGDVCVR